MGKNLKTIFINTSLCSEKLKKVKEGASSLLKLSNEYLIENLYFSKILIFLCSALETYKPIDFGKKAIYGAFAKLTKNLEQE